MIRLARRGGRIGLSLRPDPFQFRRNLFPEEATQHRVHSILNRLDGPLSGREPDPLGSGNFQRAIGSDDAHSRKVFPVRNLESHLVPDLEWAVCGLRRKWTGG